MANFALGHNSVIPVKSSAFHASTYARDYRMDNLNDPTDDSVCR